MKAGSSSDLIPVSDNLINGGTYIGNYNPGSTAYIKFNAIVPQKLDEGCYDFKM
jgi:hypothetical protein